MTLSPVTPDTVPALSVSEFRATATGLQVHNSPDSPVPFDAWQAYGRGILYVRECLPWVIGDWLNYGERAYGEKYAQAVSGGDYRYGTLRNQAWVAAKVPYSIRRSDLSWSHHKEVAHLPVSEQVMWLGRAASWSWSTRELRDRIRDDGSSLAPPQPTPVITITNAQGRSPGELPAETATGSPLVEVSDIVPLADPPEIVSVSGVGGVLVGRVPAR